MYNLYFEIIEKKLVEELAQENGDSSSYYKALKGRLEGLNRKAYNSRHKAKLEYLASLVQKATREELSTSL